MTSRTTVIGSLALGGLLASVVVGAFAIGIDTPRAEVGSCAAYAGLPSEEGETAGMAFLAGGTFRMGSERHQPEERFPTSCTSTLSGSTATKSRTRNSSNSSMRPVT